MYLLDTNAFSDLVREHPRTQARLAAAGTSATDSAVICPTVRGEVLFGLARLPVGKKRRDLEGRSAQFFGVLPCVPVPPEAGDHYARIKVESQQHGIHLGDNDLWIAATAIALNAVLVTRDADFRNVPGLTIEDWSV